VVLLYSKKEDTSHTRHRLVHKSYVSDDLRGISKTRSEVAVKLSHLLEWHTFLFKQHQFFDARKMIRSHAIRSPSKKLPFLSFAREELGDILSQRIKAVIIDG
jgi:hypothetical protein